MTALRPLFSNGAVLAADDLNVAVDADRDRDARHARHLHTPGVGRGLNLTSEQSTTSAGALFVQVTVQPGYAVDRAGRELVLSEPLPLAPERFKQDVPTPALEQGTQVTVWHPVFLRGVDEPMTASAGKIGCGTTTTPVRMQEEAEVEFGIPGDETADEADPAPDAGPVLGPWRVLIGFVKYSVDIDRFVDAGSEAEGVRVAYAGVRADLVAGRGGRVVVRPTPRADAGVPAVVLDAETSSLVFGLHNSSGGVDGLFTVDGSGNVTVKGTVKAPQASGGVLVNAGTAFDGMILPLPTGANEDLIVSGAADLILHVTPRLPDRASAPATGHHFGFAECRVDAERRVRCWGTWFDNAGLVVEDRSAAADYLVLVSAAALEES